MNLRTRSYGLLALCFVGTVASGEQQQEKSLGEIVRDLAPGQSYTTNVGLTFKKYQQGAGVPDAAGWYLARSVKGGFSVRLPEKFNDVTSVGKTEDGAVLTVYSLGTMTKDGIRFLLSCYERSDSKFKDGVLMVLINGVQEKSQRFTSKPFSQGGMSGFEFRGVYANGADFAGRDFMSQQRLCEFIIEFPKTPWAEIPAAVRTSLESFQSTASTSTAP